jgi:hypothetical protein
MKLGIKCILVVIFGISAVQVFKAIKSPDAKTVSIQQKGAVLAGNGGI